MELGNRYNCDWFLQACQEDNLAFVRAAIARFPDLVWSTNEYGLSGIHIACENGNLGIVSELVRADPRLCALKDRRHRTPLHLATIKGNLEIIVAILDSRPESVTEVTSLDETVLHLATKHHQIHAFKVLLDEILKHNQDHLLHKKDFEGNNVLHLAVQQKLVQIAEWLVGENPKHCPLVRMDSTNGQGLTACELHCGTDHQENEKAISLLLHGATTCRVAEPVVAISPNTHEEEDTRCSHLSVLDVVWGVLASAMYTSIFDFDKNLNNENNSVKVLSVGEMALHPGRVPTDFYTITFMTVTFTVSVVGLVVSSWSTTKTKGKPFRIKVLLSFILTAFFLSYALTVVTRVPKFCVAVNESPVFKISSFCLVWVYDIPLIILPLAGYFARAQMFQGK